MVSRILERVRNFMSECGMPSGGRIIVGLSGGADSVALLSILNHLGYDCVACHCNFHLRGEESNRDFRHAELIANRLHSQFHYIDFDVDAYCKKHHLSIEMACRELRYDYFERMRNQLDCGAIAVAHHRDDNIETFFQRLLRSAGLRGLAAMRPVRDHIVRPLLCLGRRDIEGYLAQEQLNYVVDHTNLSDVFQRNRIRNRVLPALYEQFPDAARAIDTSIGNLREASDFVDKMIAERRNRYVDAEGNIDLSNILATEGTSARFLLLHFIAEQGLDSDIVSQIIASAAESGRWFGPYLLDRGRLLLVPQSDSKSPLQFASSVGKLPKPLHVEIVERHPDEPLPRCNPDTILLDESVLNDNPIFELRSWQAADRIAPFAMRGTKKVSDILRDAKVPLSAKPSVMVLTRNGTILWVVGIRASRHFPISGSARRYLRISCG